ncbi:hypothetical protein ACF0H5_004897 [Mactra antiquata]
MSVRKAAALFKVPKSTVADRVSGRFGLEVTTAIPGEVEKKIVKTVKTAAEQGTFFISKFQGREELVEGFEKKA